MQEWLGAGTPSQSNLELGCDPDEDLGLDCSIL